MCIENMLEKQHELLEASFFDRPATEVAPDLLGLLLVHQTGSGPLAGIVVETEAYMRDDPAFHAWGVVDAPTGLVKPTGRAFIVPTCLRNPELRMCISVMGYTGSSMLLQNARVCRAVF